MKKLITILLCLPTLLAFSQQTRFNTFVKEPKISWAMHINDTVRFTTINLPEILIKQAKKNQLKIAEPVDNPIYNNKGLIKYVKESDLEKRINRPDTLLVNDADGVTRTVVRETGPFPPFDSSTYNLAETEQIYFIENGKLQCYVPYITTLYPVTSVNGIKLGHSQLFSTAINNNRSFKPTTADKIIFVTKTTRLINLDSVSKAYRLKELYGHNLLESLWPSLGKGLVHMQVIGEDRLLKPSEVYAYMIKSNMVVPVYDSVGEISRYITPMNPLESSMFKYAELAQDWFYDQTQNIVFCRIREMTLYYYYNDPFQEPVREIPSFKIIF